MSRRLEILMRITMNYKLLPFTFSRISSKEVLVNELGDMMAVPKGTVNAMVTHSMNTKSELWYLFAHFRANSSLQSKLRLLSGFQSR